MKAIKYTRFSSDGQSNFSIERQDSVIDNWILFHKVEMIDSFKDEGHSARNFDRPDVQKLFSFINKHHRNIDYLVVSELTRFSREAGDAINMVKSIQHKYGIRIVSASRGAIYDVYDSNSFFMMGLEFLLGHSENIKRMNDINGGIYIAKAEKGKWIQGGPAPYGYIKTGTGDHRKLEQQPDQAAIVRYIYEEFLMGKPAYMILQEIREKGFPRSGNAAVQDILRNPLYMGYQQVKPWKNLPGGLFPLKNFEPIVSIEKWNRVQDRFKARKKNVLLSDEFPLRSIINCHCGKPLTAAPSRSRNGSYYGYYKCNTGGHLNKRAETIHEQMEAIMDNLTVPDRIIDAVRKSTYKLMEEKTKEAKIRVSSIVQQLTKMEGEMQSLEQKFIQNQVNFETYNRWHSTYSTKMAGLREERTRIDRELDQVELLVSANLERVQDLKYIYTIADTVSKQNLIKKVFDNRLYYQKDRYRTTYIMPLFAHNLQKLSELHLLEFDGMLPKSDDVEVTLLQSNQLTEFILFLHHLKVA